MVAQVSIDARLTGLMPALSARERAILILGSFKNKTQEDPRWRSSMPSDQAFELHRLIGLINACGVQLGHLVTFLVGEVEKLELRVVHLITLRDWELNLAEIDYAAAHLVREPMTETAYQDLVKKASLEYVPLAKLAETLALEERAWADEDLEQLHWAGDLVVKDEAWRRLVGGAAARLLAAASAGDLESTGSGKTMRIKRASFDAWLGRAVTPYPDWAGRYDVRPDEESGRVDGDRKTLAHLQLALEKPHKLSGERAGLSEVIGEQTARIQAGMQMRWEDVRAVEIVIDEIAAEFGGEDPLRPLIREALDKAKAGLPYLNGVLEVYDEAVELHEPDDANLTDLRALVERNGK